jgi:hypothetical protein
LIALARSTSPFAATSHGDDFRLQRRRFQFGDFSGGDFSDHGEFSNMGLKAFFPSTTSDKAEESTNGALKSFVAAASEDPARRCANRAVCRPRSMMPANLRLSCSF